MSGDLIILLVKKSVLIGGMFCNMFIFCTDEICEYFGVKIGMYFSWLGFYTSSLVYPAVFGMMLWFFTESDQARNNILHTQFITKKSLQK